MSIQNLVQIETWEKNPFDIENLLKFFMNNANSFTTKKVSICIKMLVQMLVKLAARKTKLQKFSICNLQQCTGTVVDKHLDYYAFKLMGPQGLILNYFSFIFSFI